MKVTSFRRTSRSGLAALAVAGLVSSFGAVSLFTAPAANAAGITDVVINEVESNGDTANGDWIELYNNGTTSVNLAGVQLADNDNSHVVTITSGTIAAGGYFTVRTDVAGAGTTGDFGLGGIDSARLYAAGATVGVTAAIDEYSWSNHASTTYGRVPNGTGGFVTTTASTRNASNSGGGTTNPDPAPLVDKIVINEVESSSDAVNGNWIELRNTTGAAINVGGAILSDNNNGHTLTIPSGTTIAGGGVKAFVVESAAGPSVGSFGLGPVDSARLFMAGTSDLATATPVDSKSWDSHSPFTYGLDSSGVFRVTSAGTFDGANTFGAAPVGLAGKVVINEVESNNGGTNGDWVELRNNSAVAVKIELAAISDADNTHVFSIPAGTPDLAPGAYAAFRVDNPAVDGNFGLGNVDAARLFDAGTIDIPSATAIDSFSWTAHAGNTWGRIPNGTGSFVNTAGGTFGSANS